MTASQFFLAVLLATFQCQTQAYDKVLNGSEDLRNVTKCSWNCKVIESDLLEKINKGFTRTRVTEVAVIYKMKVDEKYCANLIQSQSSQKNCKFGELQMTNLQVSPQPLKEC